MITLIEVESVEIDKFHLGCVLTAERAIIVVCNRYTMLQPFLSVGCFERRYMLSNLPCSLFVDLVQRELENAGYFNKVWRDKRVRLRGAEAMDFASLLLCIDTFLAVTNLGCDVQL